MEFNAAEYPPLSMPCTVCRQSQLIPFLDLGQQPLANKYPTEAEFKTEDFFPLVVLFCPQCKNVQLGTSVSRERMFVDYYYLSSVNLGLVRHFEALAQTLAGARFVVDVGSNDGILLRPLQALGVRAIGVDPSINVGKIANDAGLTTLISFFDLECAEKIKRQYGQPDVIVASSIFTHVADPHAFIEAAKMLLTDDGDCIIEVEYIGHILQKIQFERFYLDRIFYYSLTSLKTLFESHGMFIADVEEIEPHGGSLRVTARKAADGHATSQRVADFLSREERELSFPILEAFSQTVSASLEAFRDKLREYQAAGLRVAGYSAPARVATICNYGAIGPDLIEFIVDDSPLKQGRFSPGTHIPIVAKEFLERCDPQPDVLVVFAYEYLDDIRKKTNNRYRYLIPIPPREV